MGLKSDNKLLPIANNNNTLFRPLSRKSTNAFVRTPTFFAFDLSLTPHQVDNYVHFVARVDDHVQNVYALGKSTSPDGVWLDMSVVRDCLHITVSPSPLFDIYIIDYETRQRKV